MSPHRYASEASDFIIPAQESKIWLTRQSFGKKSGPDVASSRADIRGGEVENPWSGLSRHLIQLHPVQVYDLARRAPRAAMTADKSWLTLWIAVGRQDLQAPQKGMKHDC